ncbi:E3 ubiquitin-protein ligase HERC2 [Symbiodinium microadriaticum]|uniref:E3 ubiquitin-protein ligase HERC2 n=1 Tax=Symbiodinium microadriaticum TaxID=2951 RepID=A0A1Q9EM88_SYMMI|nr:E3 ubiquitin-protein ligase HERC2 [Symbiodinium microadriaticum]
MIGRSGVGSIQLSDTERTPSEHSSAGEEAIKEDSKAKKSQQPLMAKKDSLLRTLDVTIQENFLSPDSSDEDEDSDMQSPGESVSGPLPMPSPDALPTTPTMSHEASQGTVRTPTLSIHPPSPAVSMAEANVRIAEKSLSLAENQYDTADPRAEYPEEQRGQLLGPTGLVFKNLLATRMALSSRQPAGSRQLRLPQGRRQRGRHVQALHAPKSGVLLRMRLLQLLLPQKKGMRLDYPYKAPCDALASRPRRRQPSQGSSSGSQNTSDSETGAAARRRAAKGRSEVLKEEQSRHSVIDEEVPVGEEEDIYLGPVFSRQPSLGPASPVGAKQHSRLLDSSGRALVGSSKIIDSSVRSGDCLSLHLSRVQIKASSCAFAAILGDGSVATWGKAEYGGDSSAVQDQLKNVQQIQASVDAFAAVLGDGSVLTWGDAQRGGDSSAVQDQLKNVQQIQASENAFAAVLGDGSVVTWGKAEYGGDSSAVQDQLKNVQQIQASGGAFAAVLGDGSVVTWGNAEYGGDSSAVQDQLKNVQQIQASCGAFAAILGDGSVVTWGDAQRGGDSSAVQDQLKNVQQIQASFGAFAAVLGDGSVVTWGDAADGGDSSAVQDQLINVQQIQASEYAFAAVLGDGSVVTWGKAADGGDSSAVQDQLKNVQQIQASFGACAAILGDGSLVTWGHAFHGGDSSSVQVGVQSLEALMGRRKADRMISRHNSRSDADLSGALGGLDTLSLAGSYAPSMAPSPHVAAAMMRNESWTPKFSPVAAGSFVMSECARDPDGLKSQEPKQQDKEKLSVRILNGVSGEEEVRFDAPLQGDTEQQFLLTLDCLCLRYAGQALGGLNWLNPETHALDRFQRRKCDVRMVEELWDSWMKAKDTEKGAVLLLLGLLGPPPVRLKDLVPDKVVCGSQPVFVQLDTSVLEAGRVYHVAFTCQKSFHTYMEEARVLPRNKGVEVAVPLMGVLSREGLYDVNLVIEGTWRSDNRKVLTVGSSESELDSSSTTKSQSSSSFVPIDRSEGRSDYAHHDEADIG